MKPTIFSMKLIVFTQAVSVTEHRFAIAWPAAVLTVQPPVLRRDLADAVVALLHARGGQGGAVGQEVVPLLQLLGARDERLAELGGHTELLLLLVQLLEQLLLPRLETTRDVSVGERRRVTGSASARDAKKESRQRKSAPSEVASGAAETAHRHWWSCSLGSRRPAPSSRELSAGSSSDSTLFNADLASNFGFRNPFATSVARQLQGSAFQFLQSSSA